jgi:uncharacterized membrane protein
LVGTLLWGWPGGWAALAALPAILLGGSIAHLVGVRRGDTGLRIGVAVLGLMLGGLGAALSFLFFAAAADPVEVRHTTTVEVRAPMRRAWELVEDWHQRPRWVAWMKTLEPIGLGGAPRAGTRYLATLDLGAHRFQAEQVVLASEPGRRLAWRTELPLGTKLLDLEEEALLVDTPAGARFEYTLRYRVEGVLDRVAHRLQIRDLLADLVLASGRAYQAELER